MNRRFFMGTAVLLAFVPAGSAHANAGDAPIVADSTPKVSPAPPKRTNWYGWQTFLAVGASTGLLITGGILGGNAGGNTAGVGLVGLTVSAPIVHWAHGHVGSGFRSIGLNFGMTLGGALLGVAFIGTILRENGVGAGEPVTTTMFWSSSTAANLGAEIGAALGYFGATTIDALVYCREEVPAKVPAQSNPPKKSTLVLPFAFALVPAMAKNHVGLSLVGRF